MATILGYTVTAFRGFMREGRRRVAVIEAPAGIDGPGVVRGAYAADVLTIPTAVHVTGGVTQATALIEAYRALETQIGPVVDQFGVLWPNVTVVGVVADKYLTTIANRFLIEAVWQLLPSTRRP